MQHATPSTRLIAAHAGRVHLTAAGRVELSAMAIGQMPGDAPADGPRRFRMYAYSGGVMFPVLSDDVNWRGPVVVDLSGMRTEYVTPIHREHDTDRPVGHGDVEVNREIIVDGTFSITASADTAEIIDGLEHGFPWRASIGLSEMQLERVAAKRTVTVNGIEFEGPILVVRSSHLDEVSFVTVPGDYDTGAFLAHRLKQSTDPNHQDNAVNFSQWLAAKGINEATLTASRLHTLHTEWAASLNASGAATAVADPPANPATPDPTLPAPQATPAATSDPTLPVGDSVVSATGEGSTATTATAGRRQSPHHVAPSLDLAAHRAQIADEENRVEAIRLIGTSIGNPEMEGGERLTAHAIRNGWTVQQTTLAAQRGRRPEAPAIHTTSTAARTSIGAVQAAMMLRAGRPIDRVMPHSEHVAPWMLRPVNDPERDRIMNDAQAMRGGTMMDFVSQSLIACGHTPPSGFNRHATLRAAFSTGSIAAVFDQSIGSIALTAYAEAGNFAMGWTSESDALNLLPHERPRMQAAQDLARHVTGGQAKHAHRSATAETVQVDRFSRQASIDENDFINDQFGLLAETPRDFGRAAARLVPGLVAAVMLRNANLVETGRALFNTTDVTLIAAKPLTQPNLQFARAALARKKDGDATLNLPATHLIVPSALGDLAIQLTRSAVITNDSGAGGSNPIYMRNIAPVEEARLDNGMVDPLSLSEAVLAGSTTSWYLVSADGKTIEVQYLQGTGRQPIILVETLSGNGEFGVNITVKHFAGAAAIGSKSMIRIDAT